MTISVRHLVVKITYDKAGILTDHVSAKSNAIGPVASVLGGMVQLVPIEKLGEILC